MNQALLSQEHRVALLAAAVSLAAFAVVAWSGTVLYFGDAVSHLNIARKILDSKTPGWPQIGTAWLPLPHVLTALTAWIDPLWRSGAAGALPSMAGFVAGAVFLFRIVRRETESSLLAWAALGIYLANLNLLYLQSTPLNECQMMGCLLGTVWYAGEGRPIPAGLWLMAGALTRYDGWFYIPVIALYFWRKHGLRRAVVFGAIASLGPALWLLHNQVLYGNALEWYNGPYSPAGIMARSGAAAVGTRYPGDHYLPTAFVYYWKAVRLSCGSVPLILAVAGTIVLLWLRRATALLLWLPLVFYTLSIAYGSVPIFIPQWWPHSYYNTRYALELLPAIAALAPAALLPLAAWLSRALPVRSSDGAPSRPAQDVTPPASPGAAQDVTPQASLERWQARLAITLVIFVAAGWAMGFSRARADAVIVFREGQDNSQDRRLAVHLLAQELGRGCQQIWMGGGDWTGALIESGIPFRRVIHDGNREQWREVQLHPHTMVDCVIEQKGDGVNEAIARLPNFAQSFRVALDFSAPGEAQLRLWRRK